MEIGQVGRSKAVREGMGRSTEAPKCGVRAGRDGEEWRDEGPDGPAPILKPGEGEVPAVGW